eukprot:1115156-Pelagomonas_calceolata.AAC.5
MMKQTNLALAGVKAGRNGDHNLFHLPVWTQESLGGLLQLHKHHCQNFLCPERSSHALVGHCAQIGRDHAHRWEGIMKVMDMLHHDGGKGSTQPVPAVTAFNIHTNDEDIPGEDP